VDGKSVTPDTPASNTMSNVDLKKITNSFLDVRLVSLASWRQAAEINPRDRNGPYLVTQEGYDPEDVKMIGEEFVLGRSGQWLSLGHFFKMPVQDRREEFIFGTAAEVMQTMQDLPSKAVVVRSCKSPPEEPTLGEQDEMAAAFQAAKGQASESNK